MALKLIYHWFTILLAVGSLAHFVDGATIDTAITAALVAACLTVVHVLIKPLAEAFHIPVNLLSLTIISIIFNTLALWLLGSLITGFVVSTVPAAVFGAIILSILAWFNNRMVS
jgi:uncharacterized membrane protein YvlD (DUF360 family)